MSFSYKILVPPLHSTADAAIAWFIKNWGLKKSGIVVEDQIHPDVELRPTFKVITSDFHILCIEVSENVYANHLNSCVVDCVHHCLPVKLFIAAPKGSRDPNYSQNLKAAKRAGVGIIEVDDSSGVVIQDALPLSLGAVRRIEPDHFPKKYRLNLSNAENVFRNGEPAKACSLVYDELESLFRKIALKTCKKGYWANSGNLNIEKAPWANVVKEWDNKLNRNGLSCPNLTHALSARIIGVTPHRNDTGHKPKNQKELIKRDQQLRTRFESAVDLFRDLVDASRPLKV